MAAMFTGTIDTGTRVTGPPPSSSSNNRQCVNPFRGENCRANNQITCYSAADNQVYRFKHHFKADQTGQPRDTWPGSPDYGDAALSERFRVATEETKLKPEELWSDQGTPDSVTVNNTFAQRFRVTKVPVPVPVSLPGSEFWHVEMLQDYSKDWPSFKLVDGKLQFRKGFLEPIDDPKVVPFFFYRGLEHLRYSWGDRAFQLLFTAAYAGVHLAVFSWFWSSNPALAVAVCLNWGLGKLSLVKWAILLILASQGRLWLYFSYEAGHLIDKGLERLFPPVRKFFWAMFTVWALYVVLSPTHYYPLPFYPFAPGSLGAQEALI
eukprot:GHRR01004071.1.p1 GENE.GHRR01004071.1~~GHRR01004071.1.p1  ORF type:complete len:321 (+),score=73.43 GHRR01004071.1:175-1137(+)